jgi:predicted ArsR family transcriptional regulator
MEQQVYTRVLKGLRNKQIAAELGIVEKTVKFHMTHIMKKLGAYSRAELIARNLSTKLAVQEVELAKTANNFMANLQVFEEAKKAALVEQEKQMRYGFRTQEQVTEALNKTFTQMHIMIESNTANKMRNILLTELGYAPRITES